MHPPPNGRLIRFRRLAMADLPLMYRWINSEGLNQIWCQGKPQTMTDIVRKYGPRIAGEAPTDPYLILHGENPIGYIQTYLWRNYPDYGVHLGLEEEAASLDRFIGEAPYRGKGLGPVLLTHFLREIVFAHAAVASCVITPEEGNMPTIRAYEKAGFRHLCTILVPGEPGLIYLMRIGRTDL